MIIINYIEEERKRAEEEMLSAMRPKKQPASLASIGTTSYNKTKDTNSYGSYTGSSTGFNKTSSYLPGSVSKKETFVPKPKVETAVKTPSIGETYRAKTSNINQPLPRAKPEKSASPMYMPEAPKLKLNLPTSLERDFAKGALGDERETEVYNFDILDQAAKAGYLKDTRTQDEFFKIGFLGLEDKPKYAFTAKADDNVKKQLFGLLDFKTPQARIDAFKEIEERNKFNRAREAYNKLHNDTLPGMEETTQQGFIKPAGEMRNERILNSFNDIAEKNAAQNKSELWSENLPYKVMDDAEIKARYPELEQKNSAEDEKSFWDYAYDVLTVASFIPGLDTFTNIGSAVVNLIRGDYAGAGLDLLCAIPFVGEVADGVKYARYVENAIGFVKMADTATDVAKYADKAGETIALAKTFMKNGDELYDTAKVADKVDNAYDTTKAVGKKTSVFDNTEEISQKYPIGKQGHFGEKGKNTRVIKTDDPIATSEDFYDTIRKGGIEGPLPNGKGVKTVFEDGTTVIYRVKTKTPDSPAINIQVEITGPIRNQKIHFIKE